MTKWGLKVNAEKSSFVIFKKGRDPAYVKSIYLNNHAIPRRTTQKYLGVIFDSRLTWKSHITETARKVKMAIRILYPIINRNSEMSLANKLMVYKVAMRPVMTYAAQVWGFLAKSNFQHLQVLQNKILRMITNAPWFVKNTTLHNDLRIPELKAFIAKVSKKFFQKVDIHSNPTISGLNTYTPVSRMKRPRAIIA